MYCISLWVKHHTKQFDLLYFQTTLLSFQFRPPKKERKVAYARIKWLYFGFAAEFMPLSFFFLSGFHKKYIRTWNIRIDPDPTMQESTAKLYILFRYDLHAFRDFVSSDISNPDKLHIFFAFIQDDPISNGGNIPRNPIQFPSQTKGFSIIQG